MEKELQKLASLRAKRRVESWRERFKSTWGILLGLLCVLGSFTLLVIWINVSAGEMSAGPAVLITLFIGILGWFFYRRHKAWKERRFREFYEEELLESKVKSKSADKDSVT